MVLGLDFEVFAVLTNNCMETKTCNVLFFAMAVGYNGKPGDSCGFTSDKVEVPPGEGMLTFTFTFSLFINYHSHSETVQKLSLPVNENRFDGSLFPPHPPPLPHQKFVCPSDWNMNITAR